MADFDAAKRKIESFLQDAGVEFEAHEHPLTYTAQATAEVEHIPGKTVAKVVMALADGQLIMTVLPAAHKLDMEKLKKALGAEDVRLAHEDEFAATFPNCDVGAMPPIGRLYGLTTYVDESLADDESIVFQAGTHKDSVRMKYEDFVKAVQPEVVDVAFRG